MSFFSRLFKKEVVLQPVDALVVDLWDKYIDKEVWCISRGEIRRGTLYSISYEVLKDRGEPRIILGFRNPLFPDSYADWFSINFSQKEPAIYSSREEAEIALAKLLKNKR